MIQKLPIVDNCVEFEGSGPCLRIKEGFCSIFTNPKIKWDLTGKCNMATHINAKIKEKEKRNPLKQSKKSVKRH